MAIGRHRLTKSLAQYKQTTTEPVEFPGELGVAFGGRKVVEVDGRDGHVWVKLRNDLSELIQAFNEKVSPVYGLPVIVIRDETKSRWYIKGRDLGRYDNWGISPYLPRHGPTHSFDPNSPGSDIVWVWNRQMMPLAATPSGSFGGPNVIIQEGTYYQNGFWHFAGGTGSASFLPYKPTGSNSRMVLLYVDVNGNPQVSPGTTYFNIDQTGTFQIVPYLPPVPTTTDLPIAGIRLVSGTVSIVWDNIYDLRPWMVGSGYIPTGTVSHEIQQDGVAQATRPALNFVGTGFELYDSPTAIIISGTTAATTSGHTIEDDGTPLTARANLNFVGTGLVAYDASPDTIVSGTERTFPANRIPYAGTDQYLTSHARLLFLPATPTFLIGVTGTFSYGGVEPTDYYEANVTDFGSYNKGFFGFGQAPEIHTYQAKGRVGLPSGTKSADDLFILNSYGYNTSGAWKTGGRIVFTAAEDFGGASNGGLLSLYVTLTGTQTSTLALRLAAREGRFGGDVAIPTGTATHPFPSYHYGVPPANGIYPNGTWRSTRIANDLVFQRKESDVWVSKSRAGATGTTQTLFTFEGALTIEDNPLRIYNRTNLTRTIAEVFLSVASAPSGSSSVIVDIHKNGTTIFTNQVNRPQITQNNFTGFSVNVDVPSWSHNDYLTAHVDQQGSGTAAANLTVHVLAYEPIGL